MKKLEGRFSLPYWVKPKIDRNALLLFILTFLFIVLLFFLPQGMNAEARSTIFSHVAVHSSLVIPIVLMIISTAKASKDSNCKS